MKVAERFRGVIDYFLSIGEKPESELRFTDNFSLLVAVMLSAQCTDRRVNMVTPALMKAFPTAEKMADATVGQVLEYISSISYPNSKAEHLVQMARRLVEVYGGEVPSSREELVTLAGVGRKTANVVMAIGFGMPAMPVDTHVQRVSVRLGLTPNAHNPLQCERQLLRHIPDELCADMHHWLLLHGRYVCTARAPHCNNCNIKEFCKKYGEAKKEKEKGK